MIKEIRNAVRIETKPEKPKRGFRVINHNEAHQIHLEHQIFRDNMASVNRLTDESQADQINQIEQTEHEK